MNALIEQDHERYDNENGPNSDGKLPYRKRIDKNGNLKLELGDN